MKRLAVYPGTFDPLTNGHAEIIDKARRLFGHVVVVVCVNPVKPQATFSIEERVAMIKEVIACCQYDNVEVDFHYGAAVDYAANKKAVAMIRGVRNAKDFDNEITQYYFNHNLNPTVETVVLMPLVNSLYVSSSSVKELASFGGNFAPYVPECIYYYIHKKLSKKV